jgi:hypothetical protein
MRRRYFTTSGSVYIIDTENKTWERRRGPNAEILRTDSGEYTSLDTSGGYIEMICPPINPPFPRYISSTNIVSEEILNG